jgi:hypothetical protein
MEKPLGEERSSSSKGFKPSETEKKIPFPVKSSIYFRKSPETYSDNVVIMLFR